MVEFLGFTLSQWVSMLGLFLIGLLVGILIRRILSAALVILAIVVLALALGYISPAALTSALQYAGSQFMDIYTKLKVTIPYSSLAFVIGLIIGLIKG